MKIIAISGWKRSGKDCCANYLVSNGFTRSAFADVLKDMVAEEYNVPRTHCDDPDHKEKAIIALPVIPKDPFTLNVAKMMFKEFRDIDGRTPIEYHVDASGAFVGLMETRMDQVAQLYWTPRALCILKGSMNRAVDSSYWVSKTIDQIKLDWQDDKSESFVISDLRYRSEVEQLRQAFGKALVTVRINRFETVNSVDPSERDLDNHKFDIVIDNIGSLEELYYKLDMEILNES